MRQKIPKTAKAIKSVFHSEQGISSPTLLIQAEYRTQNWWARHFAPGVLPVSDRIGLKLYFENLLDQPFDGKANVDFCILYPGRDQSRQWTLDLPALQGGESRYDEVDTLFQPEVSGVHLLVIQPIDRFKYAGLHGLTDRPIKQIDGAWVSAFQVVSSIDYKAYAIACLAVAVSLAALVASLVGAISQFWRC